MSQVASAASQHMWQSRGMSDEDEARHTFKQMAPATAHSATHTHACILARPHPYPSSPTHLPHPHPRRTCKRGCACWVPALCALCHARPTLPHLPQILHQLPHHALRIRSAKRGQAGWALRLVRVGRPHLMPCFLDKIHQFLCPNRAAVPCWESLFRQAMHHQLQHTKGKAQDLPRHPALPARLRRAGAPRGAARKGLPSRFGPMHPMLP